MATPPTKSTANNDNSTKTYQKLCKQLTHDIKAFESDIKPTATEKKMRKMVVDKLTTFLKTIWPEASCELYGSYRTGLYIPTSDIDVVVKSDCTPDEIYKLADKLKNAGYTSIKPIPFARIPLVKAQEPSAGINVDVSFGHSMNERDKNFRKDYVEKYPQLRPLTLVLKYFLAQHQLNEPFTGGLSSFTLTLMIIRILQMNENKETDLGSLLLEFLKYYGKEFDHVHFGFRVKTPHAAGSLFRKKDKGWYLSYNPNLLSIEDPYDEENDAARSCSGFENIRRIFGAIYDNLNALPASMLSAQKSSSKVIALSCLIDYRSLFWIRGTIMKKWKVSGKRLPSQRTKSETKTKTKTNKHRKTKQPKVKPNRNPRSEGKSCSLQQTSAIASDKAKTAISA